jgi:MFS family permease
VEEQDTDVNTSGIGGEPAASGIDDGLSPAHAPPPPARTLRANLAAIPAPAWILFAGTFINRFGSFVIIFLVLYMTRQGYSTAQAGLALGAYGAGNLASSLLGGFLADRIGRRRTITLSMFSAAGALMLLSQAKTFETILILAALTGLTADLYRAAASAMLADLVPAGQRLTAFALYRLAINAGIALGPAIGGFLAEESFFYLFLADAVTSVIYGVIAMGALPEGRRMTSQEERWGAAIQAVANDRRFLMFLAATATITFVFFQFESTFALHVRDAGFSMAVYGMLISLNALVVTIVEVPLSLVLQRYAPIPVIAFGYLLVGSGFAVLTVAHTLPALMFSVIVWTLGEITSAPMSSAYVADLAPEHFRGRYMGLFGFTWSLGLMLGPALGALLYAARPTLLWILCGVLGALAGALVLWSKGQPALHAG